MCFYLTSLLTCMCVRKNEMYSDVSPLQRAPRNCFCWLFECHFNNRLPQIEARRLCAWILQLQLAAATSFASVCLPACLPAVAASMRQNALLPVNGQKHLPHLINCSIKLINICLCLGTGQRQQRQLCASVSAAPIGNNGIAICELPVTAICTLCTVCNVCTSLWN